MIKLNGEGLNIKKFPNNEVQVYLEDALVHKLITDENEEVNVQFYYESDQDLINLMLLKKDLDVLNKIALTKKTTVLEVMYMPYSRMDRTDRLIGLTLKHIADFINFLNFDSVLILEPHSYVTPALVNNSYSLFINNDFVESQIIDKLDFDVDTDYILFPDNGAASRYKHLTFENVLIGHKNRDFKTGEIKGLNVIGDVVNPNRVLIVDDLSSYGGTFVHSAKKLREIGFKEIYLYITHAENSIFKGELFDYVDKVITTDSILTEQNNWENKKYSEQLVVLDADEVIDCLLEF